MATDLPGAACVGPGRLDGFRIAFNVISRAWGGGAANAVPDRRSNLWGVLWIVDDQQLEILAPLNTADAGGDADHALDVTIAGPDGPVTARTFFVESHEAFVRPTDRYFDMLRANAVAQGLPEEALEALDQARIGPQSPAPRI
jgi:hypothetical protein